MLPTKFQVNWPFGSESAKNRFEDGGHGSHLGFPIKMVLAIFDLQVTSMLPTKFQVKLAFQLRRRSEKQIFKRAAIAAILISDQNYFSYIWSTSHPDASYQILELGRYHRCIGTSWYFCWRYCIMILILCIDTWQYFCIISTNVRNTSDAFFSEPLTPIKIVYPKGTAYIK